MFAAAVNHMLAAGWLALFRRGHPTPLGLLTDLALAPAWADHGADEYARGGEYTLKSTSEFRRLLDSDRRRRNQAGVSSVEGEATPYRPPAAALERSVWRLRRRLGARFAVALADSKLGEVPAAVENLPLAELLVHPPGVGPDAPHHAVETAAAIRLLIDSGLLEPAGQLLP